MIEKAWDWLLDLLKRIFSLDADRESPEKIRQNILNGMEIRGSNALILLCAIVIASVGLNINSTAVVIGAMLISPIMGSIISMGYAISVVDFKLFRKGALYFTIQMIIAIVASTIYFKLSPIKIPSEEIIARTSPTFFDLIIAFTGGVAGVIALTRKEKTNVIPGVAIATALMPPLCTIGFGIANFNLTYAIGAGYLFVINTFYITVATMLVATVVRLTDKNEEVVKLSRFNKKVFALIFLIITIPSFITGVRVSRNVADTSKLTTFCATEINSSIRTVVDKKLVNDDTIQLTVIGKPLSDEEIEELNMDLEVYGLGDYELDIIQSSNNVQGYE